MSISVLVIDDTIIYRQILSEALKSIDGVEVVGTANTAAVALAKIERLKPDIITLDLEMPEMNGIEVLKELRKRNSNTAAIMVSSFTERGGELTIKALEAGAFDFVSKSGQGSQSEQMQRITSDLSTIIRSWEDRNRSRRSPSNTLKVPSTPITPSAVTPVSPAHNTLSPEMVLIGISTGGPNALAQTMPAFPKSFPAPIFIVQHMPPLFTGHLAESLDKKSNLSISEATDGTIAQPGHAYIAPGGKHLRLVRENKHIAMRISEEAPENNCRPSVDVLFRSAANHFPGRACAVIMTGMGSDGAIGCRLLKQHGAHIIAQDEATSVVYGMPKEAVATGAVDQQVPLEAITASILKLFTLQPC